MLKVQQQVNNDVLSLYLKDKLSLLICSNTWQCNVLYLLLYEASNISIDIKCQILSLDPMSYTDIDLELYT